MHSPIVYIVEQDSEYAKSLGGKLPEKYHLHDEDLFNYIHESDWLNANTLEDKHWHRNQWNESFVSMFNDSSYFDLIENEDGCLILSFNKSHLNNWFRRIVELNNESNEKLKEYISTSNSKTEFQFPFNSSAHYHEYNDLMGTSLGGIRFVIYSSYENELEIYDVVNMRELIDYVRHGQEQENTSIITFQICQNIVGDYHY